MTVHQARLLPRLLLVGAILLVSFAITGAVVWGAFLGADGVGVGRHDGPTRTVERGAQPEIVEPGSAPGPTPAAPYEPTLPASWPAALAPPADATIVNAVANGVGTPQEHLVLVVEVPSETPAVAAALRDQLTSAGLTIENENLLPSGSGSITASGAGWEATVALGPVPATPGTTSVTWSLSAGPR